VKTDTIALSEIMLQASPIKNTLQNAASAVSVITTADINKTEGITLTPVLNKIPGVLMQQGGLNTNRITIRGIGARSQYGTNRVKAYFNSIPLSSGEGETVIEDIDVRAIEKIEIIKGPNSTSFGSGLGGVIHLFAKEKQQQLLVVLACFNNDFREDTAIRIPIYTQAIRICKVMDLEQIVPIRENRLTYTEIKKLPTKGICPIWEFSLA